jgi:hypothetical protein
VPLLRTPIVNTRQPADATGNEGAGQVLKQAGAAAAFWFKTIASFGQLASVDGADDPGSGNPTRIRRSAAPARARELRVSK